MLLHLGEEASSLILFGNILGSHLTEVIVSYGGIIPIAIVCCNTLLRFGGVKEMNLGRSPKFEK
jgi:hypothetical protein